MRVRRQRWRPDWAEGGTVETRLRIWQQGWAKSLPCPDGGVILRVRAGRRYDEWFASIDEADMELDRLAELAGTQALQPGGRSRYRGYYLFSSQEGAWVEPHPLAARPGQKD
jgi:hypothetical protein